VHKPSDIERFWSRNALVFAGSALAAKTLFDLWRDGTVATAYAFLQGKLRDHVLEPLEKLAGELFDTIRKRENIVTREELQDSRAALDRMLRDFSESSNGSTLIADLKERIRETIKDQQEAAAAIAGKLSGSPSSAASSSGSSAGAGGSDAGGAGPAAVVAGGALHRSPAAAGRLAADDFSPEQAMAALMTAYERELQAPVRGVVFGNLMTALLIQMQKLKVHTEAAMLTMGQVRPRFFV
jgi:hypothetical protein